MYSPLSVIIRREPITVPLHATVREALETMQRARIGSIVVTGPERRVPWVSSPCETWCGA